MDRWVQYRVGDWLRYGKFNYGEKYARASALFPQYQPQTFKVFQWVADRVEMVIRLTIPSWTHGLVLAGKPLSLPDGSPDTAFQKDIADRVMAHTKCATRRVSPTFLPKNFPKKFQIAFPLFHAPAQALKPQHAR